MKSSLLLLFTLLFALNLDSQVRMDFQSTHGSSDILNVTFEDSVLKVMSVDGTFIYKAFLKDSILTIGRSENSRFFSQANVYWVSLKHGILYKADSTGSQPYLLLKEFISPNFITYIDWYRAYEYGFVKVKKKNRWKKIIAEKIEYSFRKCCVEIIITKSYMEVREYDSDGKLIQVIKSDRNSS